MTDNLTSIFAPIAAVAMISATIIAGAMLPAAGVAAAPDDAPGLEQAVAQLRSAVGTWQVTTEFMAPDGSVSQVADGSYRFEWVVADRVLIGTSQIPSLGMSAGLLFYIDGAENEIEMVSVGADGKLWIMSGPLDSETRMSEPYRTADGTRAQLRFTRYNVSADRFESKMEYTTDDGETWTQGNRQIFQRAGIDAASDAEDASADNLEAPGQAEADSPD